MHNFSGEILLNNIASHTCPEIPKIPEKCLKSPEMFLNMIICPEISALQLVLSA